jgi:hypothetical protein
LLAGAEGDADAAVAARVVGAVADENTFCAHRGDEFAVFWADVDQNKVGLGGPVRDGEALEGGLEERARGEDFAGTYQWR